MSFDEPATKTATLLPWDRFQHWMHCVCVVTFDLELGQAMEVRTVIRSLVISGDLSLRPSTASE